MKLKMSFLCVFVVAAFLAVVSTSGQTTNADFQQMVAVYQKSHSRDDAEKIIKLVAAMDQPPPIPEQAREHFVMGQTIFKSAKNTNDFSMAGQEFIQAIRLAPWWPEARYNYALTSEASGNYPDAIADLKLYQEFKLPEAEARAVQDKIYTIQAKQKMAENDKAAAEKAAKEATTKTRESSSESVTTKQQNEYDAWLKKLNGARFVWQFQQPTPVSWSGPSGPFVTQTKTVFTIKGRGVWFQEFDLSANGQILHTYPAQGPHQIEGRQFTSGGKTAVISEGGLSIKIGDNVWERDLN